MSFAIESITHISKLSTPSQFSRKSSLKNNQRNLLQTISETITYNKIAYNKEKLHYEDIASQIGDKEQFLEANDSAITKKKRKLLLQLNSITPAFISHLIDLYPRTSKRVTDAIWAFLGFELAQSILMTSVIQTEADMHNLVEMSMLYQKNKKKKSKVDSSYEATKIEIKAIMNDNCKGGLVNYPFDILFELFYYIYDICDLESNNDSIYKSLNTLRKEKEIYYSNMLSSEIELNINEQHRELIMKDIKLEEDDNKPSNTNGNSNNIDNYIVCIPQIIINKEPEVKVNEEGERMSSKKKKLNQVTKKRNIYNHSHENSLSTTMNSFQMFKHTHQNSNTNSNLSQVDPPINEAKSNNTLSVENSLINIKNSCNNKLSIMNNTNSNTHNKIKLKDASLIIKKTNSGLIINRNNTAKNLITTATSLLSSSITAVHRKRLFKSKDKSSQMKSAQTTMTSSLKISSNNITNCNRNNNQSNKPLLVTPIDNSISKTEFKQNQTKQTKSLHKSNKSIRNSKDSEGLSEGFIPIKSYQIKEIQTYYHSDTDELQNNHCKHKVYNDNLIKDNSALIKLSKIDLESYRKHLTDKQCGCCVSCT